MVSVNGTTISLTRGDTLRTLVTIYNADGSEYEPTDTDTIVFTVKRSYEDEDALITKEISNITRLLELASEDTKPLEMPFTYVYDIQLIKDNGDVDTFIAKAKLKITEEVG